MFNNNNDRQTGRAIVIFILGLCGGVFGQRSVEINAYLPSCILCVLFAMYAIAMVYLDEDD